MSAVELVQEPFWPGCEVCAGEVPPEPPAPELAACTVPLCALCRSAWLREHRRLGKAKPPRPVTLGDVRRVRRREIRR